MQKKIVNIKQTLCLFLAIVGITLLPLPTQASLIIPLSLEDMISQADLIVKARIEIVDSAITERPKTFLPLFTQIPFLADFFLLDNFLEVQSGEKTIYSTVQITPLEILKLNPPIAYPFKIKQLGGEVGNIRLTINGYPTYVYNETVLLFLKKTHADYLTTLDQNKFYLNQINGQEFISLVSATPDQIARNLPYETIKKYIICQTTQVCSPNNLPTQEVSTLAFSLDQDAYSFMEPAYRYKQDFLPLSYTIDPRNDPTGNQAITTLKESFQQWQDHSALSFTNGGIEYFTSTIDNFTNDRHIRIVFNDPFNDIEIPNIVAIGGSYYSTEPNSAGSGFHEALNGFVIFNDSLLVTNFLAQRYQLEKIGLHELGHVLGLGHSSESQAIMYASGSAGEKEKKPQLYSSDIAGIQALYPQPTAYALTAPKNSQTHQAVELLKNIYTLQNPSLLTDFFQHLDEYESITINPGKKLVLAEVNNYHLLNKEYELFIRKNTFSQPTTLTITTSNIPTQSLPKNLTTIQNFSFTITTDYKPIQTYYMAMHIENLFNQLKKKQKLTVHYFNNQTYNWEYIPMIADVENNLLWAQIEKVGSYGLFISEVDNNDLTSYQAEWLEQTRGNEKLHHAIEIPVGIKKELYVRFRNTGTAPWYNFGHRFVGLYIYKDPHSTPVEFNDPSSSLFGKSLFEADSWGSSFSGEFSKTRVAILKEQTVLPGEIGTFEFSFQIPTTIQSSLYREDLTVAIGEEWMPNSINGDSYNRAHVWFPIEIVAN